MASRRRLARIAVMQTLFEVEFREDDQDAGDPAEVLERNIKELDSEDENEADAPFARALFSGALEHEEEVYAAMKQHAPQWPLERMDRMTRAILKIGTWELLYGEDAPPAVVMNEAIELAKVFGGEESRKFVNGVLNAIAQDWSSA